MGSPRRCCRPAAVASPCGSLSAGGNRSVTANQRPRLQLLRASGVEVRGHKAARLHAKWMLADGFLILGSCNFTEASQRNLERNVRLELGSAARELQEAEYDALFQQGEEIVEAPPPPGMRRSLGSPTDRGTLEEE